MEQSMCIKSPIGLLTITANECAITAIRFGNAAPEPSTSPLLQQAARELAEYLIGKRRIFDVPIAPVGTPFQVAVWEALRTIPYGETRTYAQIATQINHPKACRAVGMANNRNPIALIIPCHRVIGHTGALTGYAGGLDAKQQLLDLERQN